jgi:hypothetical protein
MCKGSLPSRRVGGLFRGHGDFNFFAHVMF